MVSTLLLAAALSGASLPTDTPLFLQTLELLQSDQLQADRDAGDELGQDWFPVMQTDTTISSEGAYVQLEWVGQSIALTDVPNREWFAPYVRDMVKRGIVSGYRDASGKPTGVFGPGRSVSVEEMLKMALVAAGVDPSVCGSKSANPTAAGAWSLPYVACAESKHFSVFADATVDVHRPAQRGEVVTTVLEAFGVTLTAAPSMSPFSDVRTSTQFAPAILRAAADGVIGGYKDAQGNLTGLFKPTDPITRAEIAKVLSLSVQVYGKN